MYDCCVRILQTLTKFNTNSTCLSNPHCIIAIKSILIITRLVPRYLGTVVLVLF